MKSWHKIFNSGSISVYSPEQMHALGRQIGELLSPGETLGLIGNLGAGKTHLTQGIIAGLGCDTGAPSPTFAVIHEYPGGRLPVCHVDFYRLQHEQELEHIGWYDYMDGETALIVEWADLFWHALPADASRLLLEHIDETTRRVSIIEPA